MLRVCSKLILWPWVGLFLCLNLGCKNSVPASTEYAQSGSSIISPDSYSFTINNPTDMIYLSGSCVTKSGYKISIRHNESGYAYADVDCVNGAFSTFIDATYMGMTKSDMQGKLVLSTYQGSDITVNVIYKYCTPGRIANSPFANSGEPGIDGSSVLLSYTICSVAQLSQLKNNSTHWNKIFRLMANLDINNSVYTHTPIGNTTTQFTGAFYGDNHVLKNLKFTASGETETGFFGYISNATIHGVRLENVDITGGSNLGALVGYNDGGTISRSMSSGTVTGTGTWVGGLVGVNKNSGIIQDSYSLVNVSSSATMLGGLVGWNSGSTVRRCYATGNTTSAAAGFQGSLVGYSVNPGNTVIDSFATGDVSNSSISPTSNSIGNVVGRDSVTTLSNNYYSGTCTANTTCVMKGIFVPSSSFQISTNSPLVTWDFVNIWREVPAGLPDFR
ncbi:MAG: hypothetical protein KDD38_01530 [Bdellovibrionales bacterium]|nr:hypothetical protein [Bdellovibrionales bacterium]